MMAYCVGIQTKIDLEKSVLSINKDILHKKVCLHMVEYLYWKCIGGKNFTRELSDHV